MALRGFDISNWQNDSAVDSAPDFVIVKATEGTGYVDPSCDRKYQRAKSQAKLLGVYHFAAMGDATAEADHFVDATTGYWQNREAILVLDFEVRPDVAWAKTWLDRVYARTGVRPLIYMSASFISAANWSPVKDADYGLWVAGYLNKYNVSNPAWTDGSDMSYDISPWEFCAMWQFTSSAGSLDRDVAFMDAAGWRAYAGYKAPAPTPVITAKDTVEDIPLPFDSQTVGDDTKEIGYSEVTQAGVGGVRAIVTRTTYTDGVATSSVVISDSSIAPVTQITTIGTKAPAPAPTPVPDPTPRPDTNAIVLVIQSIIKFVTDLVNSFKKKNK